MKRLSVVFVLVILVVGGVNAAMSAPSCAQGYGGYTYPPPPQNPHATPWVGANTPWTFYQGDWFLNGILQHFFGNQYGWAPYYAYPPTYIVRPSNWYAPQWNAWYQRNPHYWRSFEQRYPYWREHRVGQHYDQNFYNKYHRAHGEGWHQGFRGVRPPGAPGPAVRPHGATGPAVRDHRVTGPGGPAPGAAIPGVRPHASPGPAGPPAGTRGSAVHTPRATSPGGPPAAAPGPAVRGPGATGPGGHAPKASGPAVSKLGKTPPAGKKHPE
jgi:hypothetical protein